MITTDKLIESFIASDDCYLGLDGVDSRYQSSYIDGGKLVIVYRYYDKTEEYRQCLLDYITFVFNNK